MVLVMGGESWTTSEETALVVAVQKRRAARAVRGMAAVPWTAADWLVVANWVNERRAGRRSKSSGACKLRARLLGLPQHG